MEKIGKLQHQLRKEADRCQSSMGNIDIDDQQKPSKKLSSAEFYSKFTNFQMVMNNVQSHLTLQQLIQIYHHYIVEHELYLRSQDTFKQTGDHKTSIRSSWVCETLAKKVFEVADHIKLSGSRLS